WRRGDHALYSAPAHAATVPARRGTYLCLRGHSPGRTTAHMGQYAFSPGPVGGTAHDTQYDRAERGVEQARSRSLPARQYYRWCRLPAPADQLPVVWFTYRRRQRYQDRDLREGTWTHLYLLWRSAGALRLQP